LTPPYATRTADRVLEALYDRPEGLFPPEELARAAGVSREQIDAALDHLSAVGHEIERTPAGLRLARPVRLNAHLIERGLGTRRVGRSVLCFGEVDSTNDVAWGAAGQGADGLGVLAEHQRRGRGRLGRAWASPPGASLLMSVLLHGTVAGPAGLPHDALTVAAGLAVAEGIADAHRLRCELKWPNDVLLDGSKAAGVLVETAGGGAQRDVVVGLGVNVNAAPSADAAPRSACLADAAGHALERIPLARAVLRRLDGWVARLSDDRARALDELHTGWLARCGMVNERVEATAPGPDGKPRRYVGRVLDVSPLEGLALALDSGTTVRLHADRATLAR